MDSRTLRALAIAALVIVGGAVIAIGAYSAGVAHGVADTGRMIAAPPAGPPYVYVWPRPWGFGFPFFPILFFLFFFFIVRGMLWRGRWHGGGRYRYDGVPRMFDEWHRRAHAERPETGSRPSTSSGRPEPAEGRSPDPSSASTT